MIWDVIGWDGTLRVASVTLIDGLRDQDSTGRATMRGGVYRAWHVPLAFALNLRHGIRVRVSTRYPKMQAGLHVITISLVSGYLSYEVRAMVRVSIRVTV